MIYNECQEAYNEMRKVVFYQKFKFYNGAEYELPYFLVKQAYDVERMVETLVKATVINDEMRKGVVECLRAKRSRMA